MPQAHRRRGLLKQIGHNLDEIGQRVPAGEVYDRPRGAGLERLQGAVGINLHLRPGHGHARRPDVGFVEGSYGVRKQLLGVNLHGVPRLVLDPLP